MRVYFERLEGDSFAFNATQPGFDIYKVEKAIEGLTCYPNAYVVVDLQSKDVDTSIFVEDTPMFFQCIREKEFRKTHLYHWELGVFSIAEKGNVLYAKDGSLKELLADLASCVAKKPLLGATLKNFATSDSDSAIKNRCDAIVRKYYQKIREDQDCDLFYLDAQRYMLYEYDGYVDEDDFINLVDDYYVHGKFDKIKSLFEEVSTKVSITLYRGDVELYSATPNYQKAYEYYSHAEVLGSLKARYKIAQMYRFGLGVEKDVNKGYQMLQDVEKWCKKDVSSYELLAKATIALAQMDKEESNFDQCIERLASMVLWKKWYLSCIGAYSKDFLLALNMLEQIDSDYVDCQADKIVLALQRPCNIVIEQGRKKYQINSFYDNGKLIVKAENQYFNGVASFISSANFGGKSFYEKFKDVAIWEVQYV